MTSDNPQVLGANVTITPRICGGCTWTATLPGDDTVYLDGIIYGCVADAQQAAEAYLRAMSVRWALGDMLAIAYDDNRLISYQEYNSLIQSLDGTLSQMG